MWSPVNLIKLACFTNDLRRCGSYPEQFLWLGTARGPHRRTLVDSSKSGIIRR